MDYFKGFNYDVQQSRNFYLNSVKGAKESLVSDIKREIRNDLKIGKTQSIIYFNKSLIPSEFIEELMEDLGKVMWIKYDVISREDEGYQQKDFIRISY